jgi:hypothetical protein
MDKYASVLTSLKHNRLRYRIRMGARTRHPFHYRSQTPTNFSSPFFAHYAQSSCV